MTRLVHALAASLLVTACTPVREGFLFTSFREPADQGLFLAYSDDGYHWEDLGGPFLRPEVGKSRILRDPSVARGPDGTYHMVWTTDWRGGNGFGYASTRDFIHWSAQRFIPAMSHEPEVVNVWAPEVFYDPPTGRFHIVWASTIPHRFARGQEDENNNHRLYHTSTRDFREFTPTELLMDPGFSVIDGAVVRRGAGDYVMVLKDNTRPNRNLRVAFGSSPSGPFERISAPFTGFLTEGPTVVRTGGEWLIYYDSYGDKSYKAARTRDFVHFTDATARIRLPEGHKHGTIVRVPRGLPDRLQAAAR